MQPQPLEPNQSALEEHQPAPNAPDPRQGLEIKKLEAEIRNLNRRWPLFAPYVTGTLTVVAIIVGSVVTYRNSDLKRQADATGIELQKSKMELLSVKGETEQLRAQAVQLRLQADAARSERDLLLKRAGEFQAKIRAESARVKNVATLVLGGNVFNDNRLLQYSQINKLQAELKEIADEMLTPVPQKSRD